MNKFNENEIFPLLEKSENICRICFSNLKEGLKCYSVFKINIHATLQYYCSWNHIKFIEDECLPKLICLNCYNSLENTCHFLDTIIGSQNLICKFIEHKQTLKKEEESFLENSDNDVVPLSIYSDDICGEPDNRINDIIKTTSGKKKSEGCNKKVQRRKTAIVGTRRLSKKKICCSKKIPQTDVDYVTSQVRSHVERKSYQCSECDKKYRSYFDLQVHLRFHSGERPFTCSACGKTFVDKRNLRKHEKIHSGKKTHECSVCHNKFLHLFTLKTHERIHTGEKPFVCENCGKSFNTSTELKIHHRTHTNEKPYQCNICEKVFSSKSALNTHMIVHTGEKKFICTICSRKCRTSFDLKTHMRCHSSEKPYACRYRNCDKKYKNSSQLNVHLRTHKGEKPHQCPVCFKHFGESNTLKRHMGVHQKNVEKLS